MDRERTTGVNHRAALACAAALLGACDQAPPIPASAPRSSASTPAALPTANVEAERELTLETFVDLQPKDGSLRELLAVEATKAIRGGRRPFVELRAGWCPTCRRVDAVLAKSPTPVPRDIVLIRIDTDAWHSDLRGAGLQTATIPAFFAVDARGRPTAGPLLGDAWRLDRMISRKLTEFFDGTPQENP